MRKKRDIGALEHKAQDIQFPSANHEFDRFKSSLREIIDDNCGYTIAKTLEYCDYDQVFYVKIEVAGQLLTAKERADEDEADNACVTLTRGVTINPKEPLMPQIEKINEVRAALQGRFNKLSTIVSLTKDGYKLTK